MRAHCGVRCAAARSDFSLQALMERGLSLSVVSVEANWSANRIRAAMVLAGEELRSRIAAHATFMAELDGLGI